MARRRFIHPDYFLDEDLVTLPPFTRLLFAGLWCLADREGRLADKPVKIKMQLFPADAVDVDAALGDLARAGMVTRYTVDGTNWLQVNNFAKYQHPHPREAPSAIPPPDTTKALPEPRLGAVEQAGYSGSSDTRDPRSVGVPAATPAASPPAAPARPKPLAYRPRLDVAWPGRPPVPSGLHREFIDKLGGDPEAAERRLVAWYPEAAAAWQDRAIGDDDFAFWRHRFREWQGSTRQADRARASPLPVSEDAWCPHDPPCQSREWCAMLQATAAAKEATA